MPRTDAENTYSDAQAITTDAASTNVIDHGSSHLRSGGSYPWNLEIIVTEAFAGGASLAVYFEQSDDEAFTAHDEVLLTDAILTADLVQGYKFPMHKVPPITKRYSRIFYDVDGTMTAGRITAHMVFSHATNAFT
ncbi:MAG: Bbp16 family capsid cement protein [Pseudomonadota bacterium]